MLHHPCFLGDPQQRGRKSQVATSPLPSWTPRRGRKCYVTPAFSGIPNKRGQTHKCLTLAFSGSQKRAEMLGYCGGPGKGVAGTPTLPGPKFRLSTRTMGGAVNQNLSVFVYRRS